VKSNIQLNDQNSDNSFNNIESVESIYPADAIDIIDTVSTQLINDKNAATEPNQTAANDQHSQGNIYSFDNARMLKKSKSQERRSLKSRLTDRRSDARVTASGEPQYDRREANRIANIDAIRLTSTII